MLPASAAARTNLDEYLSLGVAVVLILVYGLNLVYTLVTHKDVFALEEEEHQGTLWPVWQAAAVLLGATALIALESELLSGALDASSAALGLSPFFLGIIVLAVVGNFAEYIAGSYFARQGKIGLAINIAVGATIQVALFTAPLLVIISYLIGKPMNLVFSSPLELVAIVAVALIVTTVTKDGEATWFEGVLLDRGVLAAGAGLLFRDAAGRDACRPGASTLCVCLRTCARPRPLTSASCWRSTTTPCCGPPPPTTTTR